MTERKTRIAVIGAGASGVAMCQKLYEQVLETVSINSNNNEKDMGNDLMEVIVFEKAEVIGPGLPYSSPFVCHPLNFPKNIMADAYNSPAPRLGLAEQDPSAGVDNLANSYRHTLFPPRYLFGHFLAERAMQVRKAAAEIGIHFDFRPNTEVLNVVQVSEDLFEVETSGGEKLPVNYVAFCTGHLPSSNYCELIGKTGYWHIAYDSKKALSSLSPEKDAVVLGTRKSAIDVALRLLTEDKLQGTVTMVSRDGLLPSVYADRFFGYQLKYIPDYLKGLNDGQPSLDALVALVWQELSDVLGRPVDFNSFPKSYKEISAIDWLDGQIKEARETPKIWQQALLAVFPLIPPLWNRLSFADQTTFLNKYYSLFMTYAAGFPLEVAGKIRQLMVDGRLKIRGGLTGISCNEAEGRKEEGRFTVNFSDGSQSSTDQLFNATGAGYDIHSLRLYRNMCQQGSMAAHPMGGISIDVDTLTVLNKNGEQNGRLFAVGELTRGVFLLTADIRRCALHADIIARQIVQNEMKMKKLRHFA